MKTKPRNRVDVKYDMNCALSNTSCRIHELPRKKTLTSFSLIVKLADSFGVLNKSLLLIDYYSKADTTGNNFVVINIKV